MHNFKQIAVVGMGLIGSSLAAAFKKTNADLEITAVDKCQKSLEKAEQLGIIDQGFSEIDSNLEKADIIFLAVPVGVIAQIIKKIKNTDNKKQLIVDLGSTKKEIMIQAAEILKNSNKIFIGAHPMAGSHKSGIEWHDSELFRAAPFILTPQLRENKDIKSQIDRAKNSAQKEYLEELKNLIETIGSRVYIISAEKHDHFTAYLSHLPHLLSSALVNLSDNSDFESSYLELSGSGYRDMTRIAAGSAELWQDIIASNSSNLAVVLKKYIAELEVLQHNLENNNQDKIYNFLTKAVEIQKKNSQTV